jgi:hypothetical protein
MLSLLIWFTQIWCSEHWRQQHMQQWWLLKRRHNHMLNEHQVMTSFPLLLKCMNVFIFILTTCAHTTITRHHWFSLVPSTFVFYYWQRVSIAL